MKKRSNEEWLNDLRASGPQQEAALADLRAVIVNGLPYALSRWLSPGDPHFDPLVDEVAQDTLLRVLERMDSFEGRSQFTTWVHTIAVRLALTELRRKRWENTSLEALVGADEGFAHPQLMSDPSPGPERSVEGGDMLARVQQIIDEELTDKQRQALIAMGVHGLPASEVAQRMGTNRNALYKLMHDARLRLKKRLQAEGLTPEDVLKAFE